MAIDSAAWPQVKFLCKKPTVAIATKYSVFWQTLQAPSMQEAIDYKQVLF